MHRPGIAGVQGDRLALDGTTIEHLGQCHLKTLELLIGQRNAAMAAYREREEVRLEAQRQARAEHERAGSGCSRTLAA